MRRMALVLVLSLSACVAGDGPGGITGAANDDLLGAEVGRDAVLAPGIVGRACAVGRRPPGEAVERFPAEGPPRWRIYDTVPGSTQPRTHYVTGFSDGCARQVTGALVTFGGPAVYEAMRLSSTNRAPRSATDKLYDRIKSRVCGVSAARACPASRLGRLEDRVTFVTVYPRLGDTGNRLDLLLDHGDLVAEAKLD